MTMEAAPTEMAKSEAICGNSVSAARTRAWLAKLASASAAMARIVRERDWAGAGDGVDSIGGGGLCTAPPEVSQSSSDNRLMHDARRQYRVDRDDCAAGLCAPDSCSDRSFPKR